MACAILFSIPALVTISLLHYPSLSTWHLFKRATYLVSLQDVFLMIRRDKMTIFLDATEETTVLQLKKMLEGIIKKPPEDHKLYNVESKEVLEDSKSLGDCGYKSQGAKAQDPAAIGLAYRISELIHNIPVLRKTRL